MFTPSAHRNLTLLWWQRNIAIAGQASAVLFVTHVLRMPLAEAPLWAIIAGLAAVNALTWWRLRRVAAVREAEFFAQLMIDITALAGLLYFSGGATNPFASLFILQVIIAAITLRPLYTWIAAAAAIAFYSALMVWNVEIPYLQHHHLGDFFSLHVQGMWLSFVLLSTIVAWFVVRMNTTIRKQDARLASAEKMAAIGNLAANAAHELGTPLATLFLLSENTGMHAPALMEQLLRCKKILSRITAAGGVARAESGAAAGLGAFLETVIADWRSARPDAALEARVQPGPTPRIVGESGLAHAIRNLLDNAADASPGYVALDAAWTTQHFSVTVSDRGPGFPADIAPGTVGATTKPDGMGMGIFLARSVVARLEGTLHFVAAETGGIVATMTIPLRSIRV